MAVKYALLTLTGEIEALDILADGLEAVDPAGRAAARAIGIKIDGVGTGRSITAAVPQQRSGRLLSAMREAYFLRGPDSVVEEIRLAHPPGVGPGDGAANLYKPLAEGVADLLYGAAHPASLPLDAASDEAARYLLAAWDHDQDQAAALLRDLLYHATATRAASVEASDLGRLYLYDIVSDPQRGSSFETIFARALPPSTLLLHGVSVGADMLYLEQEKDLSPSLLRAAARLLRLIPRAAVPPPTPRGGRLRPRGRRRGAVEGVETAPPATLQDGRRPLAALFSDPRSGLPTLLDLRDVRFLDQVHLYAPAQPVGSAVAYALVDTQDGLDGLQAAVRASAQRRDVRVGYYLRLQPARRVHDPEQEARAISAQIEDLQDKLTYVQSMTQERPRLLRFWDEDLPALADYVRRFHWTDLQHGALSYAFQGLESDGRGCHFLLVAPTAAPRTPDPLPLWGRPGHPLTFWLDPYWAKAYFRTGRSALFVPENTFLAPTIHIDPSEAMDAYLEGVLKEWFRAEGRSDLAIPHTPYYLFEQGAGDDVMVSVLDAEQFKPLTQRLDWLNDNLHLQIAQANDAAVRAALTGAVDQDAVRRTAEARAAQDQVLLDAALRSSVDETAQIVDAIAAMLTARLQELETEGQDTLRRIQAARAILADFATARDSLERLVDQRTLLINGGTAAAAHTDARIAVLEVSAQKAIERAEKAQQAADKQVAKLIDAYDTMRARLYGRRTP